MVLLPIFIFIMIIIFLEDGLPVFFRQKRVGKNNKYFQIYKFRTMKKNTPNLATHLLKNSGNYFTLTGPFLRKSSLDEIPQLINIIKGDMVFVGPRPALYNQEDLIILRKKSEVEKLTPGITGWAQVNGRDLISIEAKVAYDKYYLDNKSILLDLKILILSFIKVIKFDGVLK